MNSGFIFISHATTDGDFVEGLRGALDGLGLKVWVDSRALRGGNRLAPEISDAIEQARQVIVVLSPHTINSPWVRREIQFAQEIERKRQDEGYRVVPMLLPGVEPSALAIWFDEEPSVVAVRATADGLSEALPSLLVALGERLPDDLVRRDVTSEPVEELLLVLTDCRMRLVEDKQRVAATAKLVYKSADRKMRDVESKRYQFTAPLGSIEADEVRWYLESYYLWPTGVFRERALQIEAQLPRWGQDLFASVLAMPAAQNVMSAWLQNIDKVERRLSILVDAELMDGHSIAEQREAREASATLLSLPWELMHDGRSFLFHGARPVLVRRRLPSRHPQNVPVAQLPIRILMVSPRPGNKQESHLDHRISARPLVEALESLGELATLSVLTPPTFPELERALQNAADEGKIFDVVHLDCYGVFDHERGKSSLCFEDPRDTQRLDERGTALIGAEELSRIVRHYNIPLLYLDASHSAKSETAPTVSIAATLLEEGVTSVVAMSHTVLDETAHRFVKAFYRELAEGKRVGTAMLAGQRALYNDTYRGKTTGAGELRLQDWFVPVLYQEEQDPQLITKLQPKAVQQLQAQQRRLNLGVLPDPPPHAFQGRSRELLSLERLLHSEPYAVIRGQGGSGKTTLAVEFARWMVRTRRFQRAAFVSLEQYTDARRVLDSLGRQLLLEGESWSVALDVELKQALQPIERALRDHPTIIVLDNMESVLPDKADPLRPTATSIKELFDVCKRLLEADSATRLVFTSRVPLLPPFDNRQREVCVGALRLEDAVKLVSEVMKQEGVTPKADESGSEPQEITDLVETVDCHARTLVLLAREVARRGVRSTVKNLHQLMAELDTKHRGDRENSLYASVELSLRRLPPEAREQIKALGVFHGGVHLAVLSHVLGAEADDLLTVSNLARQLIEVGLAEAMAYGHLRLEPALPPYLLREMSQEEQEELRSRWAAGMKELTQFLYRQRGKDAELSARLTLLELPNLMAMLEWIQDKATPEQVVDLASHVESLLSRLGRPQALAQATKVREQTAQQLGEWSHARYLMENANIQRRLDSGDLQSAYTAAQQFLQQCLASGEDAYPGADYDIAMAYFSIARVRGVGGDVEAALPLLSEAQRRFQRLADAGNTSAERMTLLVITESGDCYAALGRFDEAAEAYGHVIKLAEKYGDQRLIAVNRGQLGGVQLLQQHYAEALESYAQARNMFENLGEPGSVAVTWHQIGRVHAAVGQYEQAERAYQQSLAIRVQQKDVLGEAGSLHQLGSLYSQMGRLEEAVKCYQQATDINVKLQNINGEGSTRNNLAIALMQLQRYDEARRELLRAIECKKPYGHAAELWKSWAAFDALEQLMGNKEAALRARQQAIQSYRQYRLDGGQGQAQVAMLCTQVARAIQSNEIAEAQQVINQAQTMNDDPGIKNVAAKLLSILKGDRNPELATDPDLDYFEAVELQLLLETLRT
jgi:tetratricopeptide (TPR) repeat protein